MQLFRAFLKIPKASISASLFKNRYVRCFSSENEPFQPPTFLHEKPKKAAILDEELRELGSIEEYKEGIRCTISQNYELAESYLNKAVKALQSEDREFKPRLLLHVMNKLSIVLNLQGKEDNLTDLLEEIYFLAVTEGIQGYDTTFKAFTNLMIHYAGKNPQRGKLFAETVLEQHKTEPIPIMYLKDVYFFIGTIYLIGADYKKAVEYLEESIALKPTPVIRGMALHNLAFAYWWDYCEILNKEKKKSEKQMDLQSESVTAENLEEFKATMSKVEAKNKLITPNLKQAIKSFERLKSLRQLT